MSDALQELLSVMRALRDPESGCSWDRKQTHQSLAKYAIEEAYEVADAARSADDAKLCDELGDLLFQVVFHAQIASERGAFGFDDVAAAISEKLTRRHPHVFGPQAGKLSEEQVMIAWEQIKASERAGRGDNGLLADVSRAQPAMLRSYKVQQRLASIGYDWQSPREVLATLKAEIAELEEALDSEQQTSAVDELGDVLFSAVNMARWLSADAEQALHNANDKVAARINWVEAKLAQEGLNLNQLSVSELDRYWCEAKRALKLSTQD